MDFIKTYKRFFDFAWEEDVKKRKQSTLKSYSILSFVFISEVIQLLMTGLLVFTVLNEQLIFSTILFVVLYVINIPTINDFIAYSWLFMAAIPFLWFDLTVPLFITIAFMIIAQIVKLVSTPPKLFGSSYHLVSLLRYTNLHRDFYSSMFIESKAKELCEEIQFKTYTKDEIKELSNRLKTDKELARLLSLHSTLLSDKKTYSTKDYESLRDTLNQKIYNQINQILSDNPSQSDEEYQEIMKHSEQKKEKFLDLINDK